MTESFQKFAGYLKANYKHNISEVLQVLNKKECQEINDAVSKLTDDQIDEIIRTGEKKIEKMSFKFQSCKAEQYNRNIRKRNGS